MLVQMNWRPTPRQLRQFGLGCVVVPALVVWFWGASTAWVVGVLIAGLVVAITSWLAPSTVRPLFIALSLLAIPIGIVVGELVLMLLFFGLFLPIGMLFRILGRDALQTRMDTSATTHWSTKAAPTSVRNYYRQF